MKGRRKKTRRWTMATIVINGDTWRLGHSWRIGKTFTGRKDTAASRF